MKTIANGQLVGIIALACAVFPVMAVGAHAGTSLSEQSVLMEEQGIELNVKSSPADIADHEKSPGDGLILEAGVLLIPNSTDDNVGMYDPSNGAYLGLFIMGHDGFSTPICAITGPDSNIYVSDQLADAVFVFDTTGAYISTYCDAGDGLNNIRGIAFRGDHLLVTSGDGYVGEFDGPHSRLPDFINDGSDPFDIFFLEDGRALVSDIQEANNNIRLYDADGNLLRVLISVGFPEQIQADFEEPGGFLNSSFGTHVTDFDLDGNIHETTPWDGGRGVYRLENGNLLVTNTNGVFEIEPGSGNIIEQKNNGSARYIEMFVYDEEVGIEDNGQRLPNRHSFSANYPNPFNSSTTITFTLLAPCRVTVDIYDVLGNRAERLLDSEKDAGDYSLTWSADRVPSGIYFYKIKAENLVESRKMTLLK